MYKFVVGSDPGRVNPRTKSVVQNPIRLRNPMPVVSPLMYDVQVHAKNTRGIEAKFRWPSRRVSRHILQL